MTLVFNYRLEISLDPKKPTLYRDETFVNPIGTGDRVEVEVWGDTREEFEVRTVVHSAKQSRSTLILVGGEGLDWQKLAESGFFFEAPSG